MLIFLEHKEHGFVIHDWVDHNPWAAGAPDRRLKACWNAVKRHHGEHEADRKVPGYAAIRNASSNAGMSASSTAVAILQRELSNAPSPSESNAPSPSPESSRVKRGTRFVTESPPPC